MQRVGGALCHEPGKGTRQQTAHNGQVASACWGLKAPSPAQGRGSGCACLPTRTSLMAWRNRCLDRDASDETTPTHSKEYVYSGPLRSSTPPARTGPKTTFGGNKVQGLPLIYGCGGAAQRRSERRPRRLEKCGFSVSKTKKPQIQGAHAAS